MGKPSKSCKEDDEKFCFCGRVNKGGEGQRWRSVLSTVVVKYVIFNFQISLWNLHNLFQTGQRN